MKNKWNKSTWKVHNPRGHYNYLRIVSAEKYTVFVVSIIMNEIGGMRRQEEEEAG